MLRHMPAEKFVEFRCDPSKMDFCPDKIKQPDDETFFNAKHETIKPSAKKIKEYFKRTKESEKK